MSIKAPTKIIGIEDPDKAGKANQTNASRAKNVQMKEGVRTSMGLTTPFHNPPGISKKGKPK